MLETLHVCGYKPPNPGQLSFSAELDISWIAQVLARERGAPRAYLLPSPVADKRRDPDEATFKPIVCSHSKVNIFCCAIDACLIPAAPSDEGKAESNSPK